MNGGMDKGGKEGRGKEGGSQARGVRETPQTSVYTERQRERLTVY